MTRRKIEQQLVEFFRSRGGEIGEDHGESYLTLHVRCRVVGSGGDEWRGKRQVSLSELAGHLALIDDAELADCAWRRLGDIATQVVKRRAP